LARAYDVFTSVGRAQRGGSSVRLFSQGFLMKTKKCPVCDWEITDGGIKVKVGEKEITVCCDDCANKAKETKTK
jgi:hypothetical protein